MPPARRYAPVVTPLLLLAVSLMVCALAAWKLPRGAPMYDYFADGEQWARTGRITDSFTPLEYPMFVGLCLRLRGIKGLLAGQALLQTAVAMLGYALLRRLSVGRMLAFAGGVMLLLHPDLLTSVTKVWDVGLPAALLLLTALVTAAILASRKTPGRAVWGLVALLAVCFGADLSARPNLLLLLPALLAVVAWPWSRSGWLRPLPLLAGAFFVVITAGSFTELARLEHGSFFTPGNGPYNIYAGNNPNSAKWLLKNFNAEPSLFESWKAEHGPNFNTDLYDPRLTPFYLSHARSFVRAHPVQEVGLVFLKLWTLLRPDTKVHPLLSPGGALKLTLALPSFGFVLLLLLPGRPPLQPIDWWLLAVSVLYVVPFMLTNADPHLRTPMDALWICGILRLVGRRWPRLAAEVPGV